MPRQHQVLGHLALDRREVAFWLVANTTAANIRARKSAAAAGELRRQDSRAGWHCHGDFALSAFSKANSGQRRCQNPARSRRDCGDTNCDATGISGDSDLSAVQVAMIEAFAGVSVSSTP
jgi:hypothetical protein